MAEPGKESSLSETQNETPNQDLTTSVSNSSGHQFPGRTNPHELCVQQHLSQVYNTTSNSKLQGFFCFVLFFVFVCLFVCFKLCLIYTITQQDYYGRWCGTLLHSYCTSTYTEVTVLLLWSSSNATLEYPCRYSNSVAVWVLHGNSRVTSQEQHGYFSLGTSTVTA